MKKNSLPAGLARCLVIAICSLFTAEAKAQLQANFTVDKAGGCSPLTIKFTNTTTGGSNATTYSWVLGNGNTSTLASPGATYQTEKTYTITLTAKDGATTSTKSMDITVYKKPTVDFSLTPGKGCVPLPVTFTANASPGDGTLSSYLWDYGDGSTDQGGNYKTTTHIYTIPQKPPVGLTVTNSYGCYTTVSKSSLVEAVKGVEAKFTASPTNICKTGDEVSFTNGSTGSGTLSYAWDFGDGQTSTDKDPKHSYAKPGNFTVKLKVTSSDGCSKDAQPVTLNVANFKADFDIPALICQNQTANFTNQSTPGYTSIEWWVDNNIYSYYYQSLPYTFYTEGEHDIKLVVTYGNCKTEAIKKITVNPVPKPQGFMVDMKGACGAPLTINFKDTTQGAVKWEWRYYWYGQVIGSTQSLSYTFSSGSNAEVYLAVTNKEGCSAATSKYIYYDKPTIQILAQRANGDSYYNYNYYNDCLGLTLKFSATPDTLVKDYSWNFGDGGTSTDKNPTHTFSKAGNYIVTLNYTTVNGCKGTSTFTSVSVVTKPKFDFSVQGSTTICGNTPTIFTATPSNSGWDHYWYYNDTMYYNGYNYASITQKFRYDTTYTVTMIARNGNCADTITKKDYVKVLPPFPTVGQVLYTCEGQRGDVRFTESSNKVSQWSWDFGDGSAATSYNAVRDTIRHTYTKSGTYKVVLSTTYGPCTVKDSTTAYVLLKQKPVLAATQTEICGSGILNFTLSGYERNPYPYYYYYRDFIVSGRQYDDLSMVNYLSAINLNNYYDNSFNSTATGTMNNLEPGKTGLRVITTSNFYGCQDTTNFVTLKVKGPAAGFKVGPHSGCFKDAVSFIDTSKVYSNVAIASWTWNFGDGTTKTYTAGGTVIHTYKQPGTYYVTLTVTDADGCSSTTGNYNRYVQVSGPKADFIASGYTVSPNTTVYLNNTSLDYYSYYNNSLKWIFPDGSTSTSEYNVSYLFGGDGKYNVSLVTYNSQTGCTDTVTKTITVRKANSAFTYTMSYINSNACPPVITRFTSISTNAQRVSWDFGDGAVADNQQIVSHTYNSPGLYRVVHYAYDYNNAVDSTEDFIEVKGPYALMKADTLYACNTLEIKLSAEVRYAKDYTWDFGDGTLVAGTDTFATHQYLTPGVYQPALILSDEGGCTATSMLPEKIVVDSLAAAFGTMPATVCDNGTVVFTPTIHSLSQDQLQTPLAYEWLIKQGNNPQETFTTQTATYFFDQTGQHPASLRVTSPYGCEVMVNKTIDVKPGVKAAISGPVQICAGDKATFSGNATPSGILSWQWRLDSNSLSTVQNPPSQGFATAGQQTIQLIVSNGSCVDTATHLLTVHPLPTIAITASSPVLCQGDSLQLTATGGISYQWTPGLFIQNANQATATVWSSGKRYYTVKVTSGQGCFANDSIEVKLVTPQEVAAKSPLFACAGNTIQFEASGTDKYHWIAGAGLSNTQIANPVAITLSSGTYTVVGSDSYGCFTDTAMVQLRIGQLPTLNAGPDHQVIAGQDVRLAPVASNDVTQWQWMPADWLSCTNCATPVSTPKAPAIYVVKVSTKDGCSASDTVRIELLCKSELVYIPTGFTPNGDNLNDRFAIHGSGVKTIRQFVVFDRWGKKVFERRNVDILDRNSSWDGSLNGQPLPAAAYIYMVEVECMGGDLFTYKGAVTLIR